MMNEALTMMWLKTSLFGFHNFQVLAQKSR